MGKEGKLVEALKKSIFEDTMEIGSNFLELPIDCLIQNDMFRNIPIVNTIYGLGKTAINVRDIYLIKKTLVFIEKLNQNKLSREKISNHQAKLEVDQKRLNKELEYVMLMLERMNEVQKSVIMSNMYLKYMDDNIEFDWKDFCILIDILERFSIYDSSSLLKIYNKQSIGVKDEFNKLGFSRLSSLGLIDYLGGMKIMLPSGEEFIAKISPLGSFFVEQGFMGLDGNWLQFS